MTHSKETYFSIGAALLAALSNALMALLIKLGSEMGETTGAIVFWRSIWALFLIFPFLFFTQRDVPILEKLKTNRLRAHLIRGISGFLAIFLYFYCLRHLSMTISTLLYFTTPLFIPFVGYFWKKQPLPKISWVGILFGFSGVLFVLQPWQKVVIHPAYILGVVSGVIASISQFSLKLLHGEPKKRALIYYFVLVGALGALVTLINPNESWGHFSKLNWLNYFGIGVFGLGYVLFLTMAMKHGHPPLVTCILYSALIFSMFLDWLVWGSVIDVLSIVGVVFVVLGVILKLFLHSHENKHRS